MSIGARRLSRASGQNLTPIVSYSSVSVLSRRTPTNSDTAYATDLLTVAPVSFWPRLDQYGGSLELPPATATGRFYVTALGGRSWLVTPLGNRFLSIGLNSINIQDTTTSEANAIAKYGDLADGWAAGTNTELKSYGFNTAGAWSDTTYLTKPANNKMAYTTVGYFMRDYGKSSTHTANYPGRVSGGSGHDDYTDDVIYVFEPEFATFAQQRALQIAANYGSDPYYLGVISDNELPFSALTLLDNNLAMNNPADPMYAAVRSWLSGRGKSPSNYNDTDRKDWVGYVYGEYTRIIREALDMAGSGMLYLGSRLHQKSSIESPATFAAAKQYVDVFTLNYYNYWEPDPALLTASLAGSPFMVTEFYTKALNAVDVYGNQFGNTSGAGWCVQTDADRGKFYQNFTLGVLNHPNGVGWHWFRYTDNDTQEQVSDPSNVDSNKGLYKLDYAIYPALSAAMKTVHQVAYRIAGGLA
ncbi:MAG: hypothetical protein WBP26_00555 [Candidatus Saccharimonadales bacterium]